MNKKRILIIICAVALLGSALTVSRNASSERTSHNSTAQHTAQQAAYTVPDHVVYGFLFRYVARNNERIAQRHGRQTPYLSLQREANLTQGQARALSEIAATCEQEVSQQDARARVIISAFRAQFPNGIIPRGTAPPPPPAELQTMWEERNAIILRARDRLRAAFGEEAFARLDDFAKFRYGTNIRPVPSNPVRSTSDQNSR